MIPIARGDAPTKLQQARGRGLKRAINAFNEFGPGSKQLGETLKGYDVAKEALFRAQHRKCAYCE